MATETRGVEPQAADPQPPRSVSAALTRRPRSGWSATVPLPRAAQRQQTCDGPAWQGRPFLARMLAASVPGGITYWLAGPNLRKNGTPGTFTLARLITREQAAEAYPDALAALEDALDLAEDPRTAGIPSAVLKAALAARRRHSGDRRANPRNAKGTYYETAQVREMVVRMIMAYGRRVGREAIEELAPLAALHGDVEAAVGAACRALTGPGNGSGAERYSWADIGAALGIERTAAWDKYHDAGGARRLRGTQLARARGR